MVLYEDDMTPPQARRWHSWEDYTLEWRRRPDFVASLPRLLRSEDPSFVRYVERFAATANAG